MRQVISVERSPLEWVLDLGLFKLALSAPTESSDFETLISGAYHPITACCSAKFTQWADSTWTCSECLSVAGKSAIDLTTPLVPPSAALLMLRLYEDDRYEANLDCLTEYGDVLGLEPLESELWAAGVKRELEDLYCELVLPFLDGGHAVLLSGTVWEALLAGAPQDCV